MRVNQSFAYFILSANALMRIANPAINHSSHPKTQHHELRIISYEANVDSSFDKSCKHKFLLGGARRRRPYIQFDDGTYKIL